jgi:hypothetical protein
LTCGIWNVLSLLCQSYILFVFVSRLLFKVYGYTSKVSYLIKDIVCEQEKTLLIKHEEKSYYLQQIKLKWKGKWDLIFYYVVNRCFNCRSLRFCLHELYSLNKGRNKC